MNILFIGPYRQEDEWGRKSRSLLQALQKSEHTVTARPIFLAENFTYNDYTEKAEFITCETYDISIQFVLQPYAVYDGNVKKRIGIFNIETMPHIVSRGQFTKELLMDELWIDSPSIAPKLQHILNNYDADIKVKAIPPLLDVTNLSPTSPISLISSDSDLKDRFIFYYIGNMLEDKGGFRETFLAYLTTFTSKDSVALIAASEVAADQTAIEGSLQSYKESMGMFKRDAEQPLIKFIGGDRGVLQLHERIALHCDGDCMVSPQYSIATNSIVLEAALYKSTPIVNKGNACYEWWGEENLWGIESYEERCFTTQRPVPYRFTAGETWHKPIIESLGHSMKTVYIDKFQRDKKITANTKLRNHFENASFNVSPDEDSL